MVLAIPRSWYVCFSAYFPLFTYPLVFHINWYPPLRQAEAQERYRSLTEPFLVPSSEHILSFISQLKGSPMQYSRETKRRQFFHLLTNHVIENIQAFYSELLVAANKNDLKRQLSIWATIEAFWEVNSICLVRYFPTITIAKVEDGPKQELYKQT